MLPSDLLQTYLRKSQGTRLLNNQRRQLKQGTFRMIATGIERRRGGTSESDFIEFSFELISQRIQAKRFSSYGG